MCATCPFRPGSPYGYLVNSLSESAMTEASRICHCTGTSGIMGRTGKPERVCRGARNVQLDVFCALGIIKAPTDEAWNAAWKEMKLKRAIA